MNAPTPSHLLIPDTEDARAQARVVVAGMTAADEAAADEAAAQTEERQRRWWENIGQKLRDAVRPVPSAPEVQSFETPTLGAPLLPPQPDTSAQALNAGTYPDDDHAVSLLIAFSMAFPRGDTIASPEAFEALKHLKIEHLKSDENFLTLNNKAGTDPILVGINENGLRLVLGKADITAEEAMNRALAASMNNFMKENGVHVHGTEKDQALLMVAAARTGLKVNNAPQLSLEAMVWAKQQFADLDQATPLSLVPMDNPLPETRQTSEEPQAAGPLDIDLAAMEAEAGTQATAPVIEELAPSEKTQPLDIELSEEPAAAPIVEVLAPTQPQAPDLTAEAPDTLPTPVAFEVDGEGYPILRDVVELGDLPPPSITPAERAALEEIAAERAAATTEPDAMAVVELPTAESILTQAKVRPETYDQVKQFVAGREGDIIRPRDLAEEFAQAGVGTGKAHALIAALQVDGLTQPEDGGHRIVRHQPPQAGTAPHVG